MKRLKQICGFWAGVMLASLWAMPARADHSLEYVIQNNNAIARAVKQIQSANRVVCDLANSNQTYYYRNEKGELGTAWKQIALCYENQRDLQASRQYFQQGGELGFYGAPNIVGVLVVSYTWEDYQPKRLISIQYL